MENLPDGGYIVHVEPVAFIPVAIIAGIGVVMTSVFIAVNIKYRGYKLLKMTSPNLNLVMLCGALLLCVSTVLFGSTAWLPESPHQELLDIVWQINHAGIWTASVGFTLFFAPLATKTWRVHRIFTDAAVKGRVIKDDRLLCIVALFVIFDFGYLALWFGIDSPKCYVIPTSQLPGFFPVSPVNDVSEELPTSSTVMTSLEHGFTCASKYTPLWIIILMSYKGALLYYILYVAWATRYVTLPSMKDAGGLIISVFATLTSFCIATPLVTSLQRWPNAQYIVMSSAIFVPLFTVMFLHFVPKLILIRRHSKDEVLTRSFSQYTTPKQPEFSEDEIRDLAIQNASLRKEMAEKQRRYKTVLEQLRITKAKLFELSMMTSSENEMNTCASDDAIRSVYTESTGDMTSSDHKPPKRKESLARELAHKVTKALIMKHQGVNIKSDDVSVSATSSTASMPSEEVAQPTKIERTGKSTTETIPKKVVEKKNNLPEQKDPDVPVHNVLVHETIKQSRHVSFTSAPTQRVPGDLSHLPTNMSSPYKPQITHVPRPVLPILGRNSWDYYTRGTGYLRYKATVLNQGSNGTIAAITGYPVTEPRKYIHGDNTRVPVIKTVPFQSTPKLLDSPEKGVELNKLSENPKQTKSSDFKYFSTSASSRSPSSGTDMTSSLGRNDETKVSNNNLHHKNLNSVKSGEGTSSNADTDVPSSNSAFSVVNNKGKMPCSGFDDVTVTSQTGFKRFDDVNASHEEYTSGSDSDEYDNATTSMDSITCELFPPLTPRHKHYLRRYDAIHAKYLAQKQKQHKRYKKNHRSEKSEGYSSGNEAASEHVTMTSNSDVKKDTPSSRKSSQSSFSHSYLNRESKRKILARASRKFDDGYLYDSITSSDSDSDSDWGNSEALQQCWERVAQKGQLPLLRAGPITFSHTRKDGIFV